MWILKISDFVGQSEDILSVIYEIRLLMLQALVQSHNHPCTSCRAPLPQKVQASCIRSAVHRLCIYFDFPYKCDANGCLVLQLLPHDNVSQILSQMVISWLDTRCFTYPPIFFIG